MIESLPAAERADAVRSMFGLIAGRYDRANSVLSGGMHHLWRRRAVNMLAPTPDTRALDVCCGTGDLSFAMARRIGGSGEGRVVGTDFCPEMVAVAKERVERSAPPAPTRPQHTA